MGSVAYTGAGSGGHPFGGPSIQGAANVTSFAGNTSIRIDQITIGKVISINLDASNSKPEQIGEVTAQRIATSDGSFFGDIYCLPINANIRAYPVIGELIPIILLDGQYYYLYPLNVFNFTNNNALPLDSSAVDNSYSDTVNSGIPSTTNAPEIKIGEKISDQSTVIPRLRPNEGDIIIDGRFGNSIRFGYNNTDIENYPTIKQSLIKSVDGLNITGYENLDTDSCVWMVSDEELVFKKPDTVNDPRTELPDRFGGSQVIISSGRIIFNSKINEILLFSKKGIHGACDSDFSIDSGNSIFTNSQYNTEITSKGGQIILRSAKQTIIQAPNIYLGDTQNAQHMVKGDTLYELLNKLLTAILTQTYQNGAGPTGPPLNSGDFTQIQAQLKLMLSDRNFIV